MNAKTENLILPIVSGIVTAAFLALSAWIYSTGNRVTALEAQAPGIESDLKVIRDDVREIRKWVVPTAPKEP